MSIAILDLLTECRYQLMDDTGIRWPDLELVGYVNQAQREICNYKPDAIVKNENLTLVAGTKQSLPATAIRLLTVVRNTRAQVTDNTGSVTTTATSRSIRAVSRETLDRFVPTWHSDTPHAEVKHFMFDDTDPTNFYVYPAQPASGFGVVEVLYTDHPSTVTINSNLEVADAYTNAIKDYVLYRALAKDAEMPASAQRSVNHYQAFLQSITGKQQVDTATSPKVMPVNIPPQ